MSILKRPIVTEKTNYYLERGLSQYGFVVDMDANRKEIKEEIERVYEVTVERVNTMVVRGKTRQRMTKRGIIKGKSPNYKKAIVTLKEGDEIDFYQHL